MSDLATRPLTFITPAMFTAAETSGGGVWRRLSWCGRYYVFQARTPASADERAQLARDGWRQIADAEDLQAYRLAYGGDLLAAGRAVVDAAAS